MFQDVCQVWPSFMAREICLLTRKLFGPHVMKYVIDRRVNPWHHVMFKLLWTNALILYLAKPQQLCTVLDKKSSMTSVIERFAILAGGKIASLKTLGLLVLMAKAGLFLPLTNSVSIDQSSNHGNDWHVKSQTQMSEQSLQWFREVLADLGDSQDLAQSLSTFSGYIRRVKRILEAAGSESFVLLDELTHFNYIRKFEMLRIEVQTPIWSYYAKHRPHLGFIHDPFMLPTSTEKAFDIVYKGIKKFADCVTLSLTSQIMRWRLFKLPCLQHECELHSNVSVIYTARHRSSIVID